MADVQVSWLPTMELGYGRMGVKLVESLRNLGYDLSEHPDGEPAGTLIHFSVPMHLMKWRAGQRLICLTMFESNTLPESFRESLHEYDMIVVPSLQNQELFSRYHPNVKVIPLGIDPEVWKPTARKTPTSRFNFLHGGSGLRKGGDVVYEAFQQAFPEGSWGDGPEPWLTFKSPRPNDFFGQRIQQINGRLSNEDEIALYEQAHCYVQPSRGEGWGLQPLQAIAQGCPTVLTDAHGHAMFAQYGWGIDAEMTATPRGSFMLGEAGDWWEPDVEQTAAHMRWIYDNYTLAQQRAWTNAQAVHALYTWDNAARALMQHVGELSPYTGTGEWVTPTRKKYRTVLNRPHAADIAGHSFRWEAFTDYWVEADVKRILFEGGYLDPSCIDGDSGLTDEQVERAGLLSGTESFCGTCHQRLNTQPTRADLIAVGGGV